MAGFAYQTVLRVLWWLLHWILALIFKSPFPLLLMDLRKQMNRQRVQYIIDSYQLGGDEPVEFRKQLETLLQTWDLARVELALCEALVQSWLRVPMPRGPIFLQLTSALLQDWAAGIAEPTLTPQQFQHITSLDPTPVFGGPDTTEGPAIGLPPKSLPS